MRSGFPSILSFFNKILGVRKKGFSVNFVKKTIGVHLKRLSVNCVFFQ